MHCAISARVAKFGVVVFKASMLDLQGVHLPLINMCIVLYVKLIWCNGLACSYGQFGGSICLQYICALSYVSKLCGVMVLHRSMFNWRRGPI